MKIALLGDIALYGKYSLKNNNVYEYFKDISNFLKQYDHVIVNLETPFCDETFKTYGSKSAYLYSENENIKLLKYLNIDIVNLANNHIFDYGVKGFNKTKEVLKSNNIRYFGIDNKDILLADNGGRVALTGFCCYSTNGLGFYSSKSKTGVNALNAFELERLLQKYSRQGYLNIASIHAGQEHVNYPNYDHIKMARKLSSKVPYVYYGHHPHVIQGIERVNQSIIGYSLGNFCFDDVYTDNKERPLIKQSEENKKSFILSLEILDNSIVKHEIIPIKACENKLEIHSDVILKDLDIYSDSLKLDEIDYRNMRRQLLDQYIQDRKTKRDIKWYLKRFRIRYFMIIINSFKNKHMYNKLVLKYLEKG